VEWNSQHHEIGRHRISGAKIDPPDRAVVIGFDDAHSRGQADVDSMIAEPALKPRSIQLAQRNQRQLGLIPGPVPQETIDENLASVTDVHLVEPLVQRRYQHSCPESFDCAAGLAVSQEPVRKRLAVLFVPTAGQPGEAVRDAYLL